MGVASSVTLVQHVDVNKRRTKSENVSVEFKDEKDGETRGLMVAEAETYGTDKLWVVLKPIAIELDDDSSPPEDSDDEDGGAGTSGEPSAKKARAA